MGTILPYSLRSVLMAEFRNEDMSNSQFERVRLNGSQFKAVDFTDVEVKGAVFQNFHISAADISRPQAEQFPLRQCIAIVFNEEWEHRLYAERDLEVLEHG